MLFDKSIDNHVSYTHMTMSKNKFNKMEKNPYIGITKILKINNQIK